MPSAPPPRVTVSLKIETLVEVEDTGYLGTNATVQEHIDKAEATVNNTWTLLIQQGSLDPKPVRARVTLVGVTILPPKDS